MFTDRDVINVMVRCNWDETEARIYLLGVQQGHRNARLYWALFGLAGFLAGMLTVFLLVVVTR